MFKVIKFYSKECGPCKMMDPIVSAVCHERGIELEPIDIGEPDGLEFAKASGVRGVPHFILMKGDVALASKTGAMTEDDFIKFVESK